MAVRKKNEKPAVIFKQIREAIVKSVDELLEQHGKEIMELIEESEEHKAKVNFGADIDCSESEALVTTGIRFSTSVTDKRVARLDDPAQIHLFKELPKKEDKPEQGKLEEQPAESSTGGEA